MLKKRFRTISIVALFIVTITTGCVNLERVEEFAKGTQALTEASAKFYEMELETDRQLAVMTVDLDEKKQVGITPWDRATKGKKLMSEARRNRTAVAALAQYAQSLNEIATFNNDDDIEKASKELSGNLSSLATTLNSAASPEEEVLASAISGLGKIYIDLKVRKIIYEKIKLAQDDVETIINMLKEDVEQQVTRLQVEHLNSTVTREEWFNGFRQKYQGSADASEKAILSITAGNLIEDDLKEQLALLPATLFLEKLNKTASSCLESHKAIQNKNLRDNVGALVKFINDARSLLSSANQLKN